MAQRWLIGLGTLLFLNCLFAFFVSQENTIYGYDSGNYWQLGAEVLAAFKIGFLHGLRAIWDSIQYASYNYLGALPIALSRAFLGGSRMIYILTIVSVYGFPALLIWNRCIDRWRGVSSSSILCVLLVTALCPSFWLPVGQGYIDVGGLILIFAILAGFFDEKKSTFEAVVLGIGLAALVLFRRWFAFWVESFIFLWLLELLTDQFMPSNLARELKKRTPNWKGFFFALATFVFILLLLAPGFVQTVLATPYADQYSAFKTLHGLNDNLEVFRRRGGWFFPGLGLLAAAILFKHVGHRRKIIFLLLQTALIFIHFTTVQDFWVHQYYLLLIAPLLLVSWLLKSVFENQEIPSSQKLMVLATIIFCCGIVDFTFFSQSQAAQHLQQTLAPWVGQDHMWPEVRKDMPEVARLVADLDGLRAETPGLKIYVLACDNDLNGSILPRLFLADHGVLPPAHTYLPTADIDRRDGFPRTLLEADLVIVGSPAIAPFGAQNQQVILIPREQLIQGTGIGRSFRALPMQYLLNDGAVYQIYRRLRPSSTEEITDLSDALRAKYPFDARIFTP